MRNASIEEFEKLTTFLDSTPNSGNRFGVLLFCAHPRHPR